MRRFEILFLFLVPVICAAQAGDNQQQPPPQQREGRGQGMGRGEGMGGGRMMFMRGGVSGTITDLKSDSVVIKTADGKTVTLRVNGETRIMKDRQAAKLSDFKVGDNVVAAGPEGSQNQDSFVARFIAERPEGAMDPARMREAMGKEFIAGQITAVEGTKLTIKRPDGETQTIEVDENTSFRKGRESITLPDIHIGENVFGPGQLNAQGVFVPKTLNVMTGEMRMRMGPGDMRGGPPPQGAPKDGAPQAGAPQTPPPANPK